ncbi:MAG: hypothetical protein U0414_13000 [Polyangiaceae bacterium]
MKRRPRAAPPAHLHGESHDEAAAALRFAVRLGRNIETTALWLGPFLTSEEAAYLEELDACARAEAEGAAFDAEMRRPSPRRRHRT